MESSESVTPFEISRGICNNIRYFNIDGCNEEWCTLSQQKTYNLTINLTMRKFLQSIFYYLTAKVNFLCINYTVMCKYLIFQF